MFSKSLSLCLVAKSSFVAKEEQISFKDCAEAFKSGLTTSGIYTLTVPNTSEEKKVLKSPRPSNCYITAM